MKRWCIVLFLGLLCGGAVWACKVPVFRYALERWEADDYRAVVFFRGQAHRAEVVQLVEPLRRAERSNLEVELVDADALTEAQQWQYDGLDDLGEQPLLRLYYPLETKIDSPFWEGDLTAAHVGQVLDSPLRRALVDGILGGESAVWVLMETGQADADNEAAAQLQDFLSQAAETLAIPDGVLRAEDVSSEGKTADGQPIEMDDVLRTSIPLKISFKVLRLAPEEAEETIFRSLLAGLAPRGFALPVKEPVAFPVFGRGRALEGIPASKMSAAVIRGACEYLCGECSCQVKDQNPGIDLLLSADWAAKLEGSFVMIERPLPALSGMGLEMTPASEIVPAATSPPTTPPVARGPGVPRALVLTLGGLLLAVMFGTYLMMRR